MIARRSLSRVLVALCAVVGGLLFVWSAPVSAQRLHEFGFSFGSATSTPANPEPLSHPGALAVDDETGDVYVIDRGNECVEIFNSRGEYVSQFNGSAAPAGPFLFQGFVFQDTDSFTLGEGGIAVDNSSNSLDPSKGDVYVADPGHGVVDKFSSNGVYIGQAAGTSPTGIQVAGVAVDPNGALWVQRPQGSFEQFNDALVNEYVSSMEPELKVLASESDALHGSLGPVGFALD
jgi:hypothetical protein